MKLKFNFLLTAIFSMLLSSCGEKRVSHYELCGLNCPAKSVKVLSYDAKNRFGKIVKGNLIKGLNYTIQFNKFGNIESVSGFNDDGLLEGMIKYGYNENNNIIEISCFDSEGNLVRNIKYNEFSKIVEDTDYEDGKIESRSNYKYDENKNLVNESMMCTYYDYSFRKKDTAYYEIVNKYDANNNVVEKSIYEDGGMAASATYEYEYDENKKVIKMVKHYNFNPDKTAFLLLETRIGVDVGETSEIVCKQNGELYSISKVKKDKNVDERVVYDKDGKEVFMNRKIYDDNHRFISEVKKDGCDSVVREIKWNDANLPVYFKNAYYEIIVTLFSGLIDNSNIYKVYRECQGEYYIEYEYDTRGNWIKRTMYKGDSKIPKVISEREITY